VRVGAAVAERQDVSPSHREFVTGYAWGPPAPSHEPREFVTRVHMGSHPLAATRRSSLGVSSPRRAPVFLRTVTPFLTTTCAGSASRPQFQFAASRVIPRLTRARRKRIRVPTSDLIGGMEFIRRGIVSVAAALVGPSNCAVMRRRQAQQALLLVYLTEKEGRTTEPPTRRQSTEGGQLAY